MKTQELKDELYSKLAPHFECKGFKFNKTKDRFEKSEKGCRYNYIFLFHSRSNEIAIEEFIYIEHLETEKIYKKSSGHSTIGTIGNEIGKIARNPDGLMKDHQSMDLIVQSERDLPKVIADTLFMFNEVALPYYSKFGDLNCIDSILNDKPEEITVHANAQFFRFPKGLITAKLRCRKDYEELVSLYDVKMSSMGELFKNRYECIKEYLNTI